MWGVHDSTEQVPVAGTPRRGRPRPALFRALGRHEPPTTIEIEGETYGWIETFKHDSWAATALYRRERSAHAGPRGPLRIVCKFNRQQSLLGIPMSWLGHILARRESAFLHQLRDEPNVPDPCGAVRVDGRIVRTAAAHAFVPGRPLSHLDSPSPDFLDALARLLDVLHARDIAYVDLHKCENILVGDDGEPHLIDFQISARLPAAVPFTWILGILQQSDRYHLAKHIVNLRPDLCDDATATWVRRRPWWIRLHRSVAVPFRRLRRGLLVLLGVRTGEGRAASEHAPEDAVRRQQAPPAASRKAA